MVPFWIQVLDVASVEKDFALLWIVKSLDERNDGRFTAATSATESNDAILLVIDFEGDSLENLNIILGWVSELDVTNLKASVDLAFNLVTARCRNL